MEILRAKKEDMIASKEFTRLFMTWKKKTSKRKAMNEADRKREECDVYNLQKNERTFYIIYKKIIFI